LQADLSAPGQQAALRLTTTALNYRERQGSRAILLSAVCN
jgi:hypothetical protein